MFNESTNSGWSFLTPQLTSSSAMPDRSCNTCSSAWGWVTFSANFRRQGVSPTNHYWCQTSRVIALSCDIKISEVHCLVLSQNMHVTDRRTDRGTELRLPKPR